MGAARLFHWKGWGKKGKNEWFSENLSAAAGRAPPGPPPGPGAAWVLSSVVFYYALVVPNGENAEKGLDGT